MAEKLIIEIFILCYLARFIYFMIAMGKLVRYYLLTTLIRGYNFNNTNIVLN